MTIDTSTIQNLTVTGIGTITPQGVGLSGAAQAMSLGLADQLAGWAKLQLGLGEIYAEWRVALDAANGAITQAVGGFATSNQIARISGGFIAIDAVAQDGDGAALLVKLQALGLQSGAAFGGMAGGLIALDRLDELAGVTNLAFARPVYAMTNVGTVTTQDDMALKTDEARTSFGVNGSGVTVGVLSDSFNTRVGPITNYTQDIASGDLPNNVNILKDFTPNSGSDEGRAMAQLIYDLAPGANLAFYTAFISMADFANGIVALSAVARVIVDDVFYFAEPAFQDGIVAQAVDRAVDNGAIYFSSAGNSAARAYESAYRASGSFVNITGGVAAGRYQYHDFDPGAGVLTTQSITLGAGSNIVLQWDQPFRSSTTTGNGSQSDMAIVVFNAGGQAVAVVNSPNLNGDPIEIAGTFSAGTYFLGLLLREGHAAPGLIHYRVLGGSYTANEFAAPSGTSVGHSNAAGAIGVAAVPWFSTPDFGVPAPIPEGFTSRGGMPILFSGEGDRLSSPLFRDTIEFAATDGGNTTFFSADSGADADSFPNFFGTSAAAPNAAAVAALLLSKFPTATNAQIVAAMKASAIDIVSGFAGSAIGVGYDVTTGSGLIQAPAAFAALQAILDAQNSNAGAVAIIGYNTGQSDGSGNPATTDKLSIVTLEPLVAGQIIYITDRSWNGTSFTTATGDGTYAFMVPAPFAAGEVITFSQGTLAAAGVDLSELGDTIYVYFGTNADTPTKFLNAVEIGDGNQVFDGSLANTGLSVGNGAVAVGYDSGAYAGPTTHSGALLGSGGATGLVGSVSMAGLWTGDDRDTVNAIEQAVQSGPWLVAADIDLVGVGAGGGGGIVKVSGDATLGALGFNPATFFNGVTVGGNPITFGARDIVFDAADGKFFIADAVSGNNRILQGNIADLRNLSSPPTLTVLYGDTSAAMTQRIEALEVDAANNIVYFTRGGLFVKLAYDTANQAGTTLFNANDGLNPAGASGNIFSDIAINYATGDVYLASPRANVSGSGDAVSDLVIDNFIYRLIGLTSSSGAGAFTIDEFNTGTARLLQFSPNDSEYNPNPGTIVTGGGTGGLYFFPIEYGAIEGLAIDPVTNTLYFSTAEIRFNHDNDGGTPFIYAGGVIASYALTGNPTGTYTILHQQTALEGGTVPGKFGDLEIDQVTGRYYVLDTVGTAANLFDQSIYTGSLTTPGAPTLFATPGNVQGLAQTGFALNHAPTGSVTAATVTATEVAGANSGVTTGATLFTAASFSDIDTADGSDELAGAIVRISSNYQSGDSLRINGTTSGVLATQGIAYSFNASTGALVLSGAATTAEYQAAIALVTFSISGDNPTNFGAATTRGIAVAWSDGLSVSADVLSTITVEALNDAPVNVVPVGPLAAVEDVFLTITGLSVSDADASPTTKLSVTLSVDVGTITVSATILGGLAPGDITGNGTASVTLSGTQAELNATFAGVNGVRYRNTGEGNVAATLTMTTSDLSATGTGGAQTDIDTVTINVTGTNEAPVIAGFGATGSVLEQQLSVIISTATVTDADSANFDGGSLTVSITFNRQTAQDALGVATFGGITVSGSDLIFGGAVVGTVSGGGVGGGDLTVAFNANATVLAVQDVLRAVTYRNSSDTPTTSARTISYTLVDGDGVANGGSDRTTVIQAISVVAVNDAPTGTDLTRTVTEDVPYTLLVGDFGFVDPDANGFVSVVITTLPGIGTLEVDADGGGAGGFAPVTAGQEITATTIGLGYVRFVPVANANGAPYASFTFQVRDNGTTTNGGVTLDPSPNTLTFDVAPVDDVPVAVADAVSTAENAAIGIAVVGNDTDIDAGPKAVATINGVTPTVGTPITLTSGATVTLLADGTISYNPNGKFDYLITPARAAATGAQTGPGFTSASDSFSYALNGGSSTTVTVAITPVDGANDRLNGGAGDNNVTGTGDADYIDVSQGGTDIANGGEGNDALFFGAAFTPGDIANGGNGDNDQLGLQGNYTGGNALTLNGTNVTGVEVVAALPGFSYVINTANDLVAAGATLKIYAGQSTAGQTFTFNGAAETDGKFMVYAGLATDNITTGGGDDGIYFGPGRFDPLADVVNGGGGTNDQLALDGQYTVTFTSANAQNIEVIALLRGITGDLGAYNITLADSLITGAQVITVFATTVETALTVNGSAETTGGIRIFGGRAADTLTGGAGADWIYGNLGNDTLTGGAGADRFHFANVPASGNIDLITDFAVGQGDKVELDALAFAGLAAGALAANAFVVGTVATTADHRIIYDSATGALLWDADGVGGVAAVQFATLTGNPVISAAEFVIV